jgi:multicomponent Na+:H+ antiporter subunit D
VVARFAKGARAAAVLPLLVAAALLVMAAALIGKADSPVVYWVGGWQLPIGISMVADGLSRLVLLVVATVSLLALLFSLDYMARYTSPGLYYGLFLIMLAGMNGVVLAGDLFNIFVFIEVAGIASYALVAFGTEADELEASFKYLVLGTVGSTFVLVAIAIVYNVVGQLNWDKIAEAIQAAGGPTFPVYVAAAFLLMGFGLKAAMVPFHAWLPDAHPSAPAPISAMLSGVLIKASGVYVLGRLLFSVFAADPLIGHVLIVIGVLSMVVGVLMAVGQWDFKRLLAYHSISQMGYVVLAFGAAAVMKARGVGEGIVALAAFGGLFHLLNHALFKSLLFLCSGSVEYATGTRQLKSLGGIGRRMPLTAACLRIAALAISGVPPLNGFFSKLLIIFALILAGQYVLAAVTVAVSFLTLLSFAKVQRYVLGGEPSEAVRAAREVPPAMCAASVALAVLCFASSLIIMPAVGGALVSPAVRDVVVPAGRSAVLRTPEPALPPAAPAQAAALAPGAAGPASRGGAAEEEAP